MIDPLGKILIELRDDLALGTWCQSRVRGSRPGPGDVHGPGEYARFVVISLLVSPRLPRAPVQFPRYLVRCYGLTDQDAMVGYGYATDVLHDIGTRVYGTTGIYISMDDTGAEPGTDPRTDQPYVDFIAQVIAATQAVA